MWYDWLNRIAVFCHAHCSSRQLVYSGSFTGYGFGPLCESRSSLTAPPASFIRSSRFLALMQMPLRKKFISLKNQTREIRPAKIRSARQRHASDARVAPVGRGDLELRHVDAFLDGDGVLAHQSFGSRRLPALDRIHDVMVLPMGVMKHVVHLLEIALVE